MIERWGDAAIFCASRAAYRSATAASAAAQSHYLGSSGSKVRNWARRLGGLVPTALLCSCTSLNIIHDPQTDVIGKEQVQGIHPRAGLRQSAQILAATDGYLWNVG